MGDRRHNRHGPKRGGSPFAGELGPRQIQCGVGRGLLLYQVASSSIQPFGHNRHEPKTGGCAPLRGRNCDPRLTQRRLGRFTSVPSGIFIHPAVWPQQTSAKNCVGCALYFWGELGPHRTQTRLGYEDYSIPSGILVHPAVWRQRAWDENWGLCPLREGSSVPI